MKFFRQMTPEERVQYVGSFSRWYANRDQISLCVQQTGGLDSDARTNFDTGVSLMQAWPFRDQLNSSVNSIPAARCVPMLMRLSDQAKAQMGELPTTTKDPVIDPKQAPSNPRTHDASNNRAAEKQQSANAPSPAPIPTTGTLHIDQIAYLLSPEVAERAKSIKAKLDERDINSNRAKDLAIAGAKNEEIAPYAKAASDAQQFVTDTFAMIDDELAEYVACNIYIRTHNPSPEQEHVFEATMKSLEEAAKPFGSLDHLLAALTPYYKKANENGRIDRIVEHDFATYQAPISATEPATVLDGSPSGSSDPTYDTAEYKRIWTYVNRKDVAHTQKRLEKMRAEIDTAKSAGMPNIDAMEAIYAKEAELVLEEQQKALNDGEPTLL